MLRRPLNFTFGVTGNYDEDGNGELMVRLWLQGDDNAETAHALSDYIAELTKTSGDDLGLERFERGDMTIYA